MVTLNDIERISKAGTGYEITFRDGRTIPLSKRRTIPALLILIHYGEGCESDLAQGSTRIPEIRTLMKGRMPDDLIQDFYGDANKPFSELWNEEGFTFIDNLKGARRGRSQSYVLKVEDHDKLFSTLRKALRRAPTKAEAEQLAKAQDFECNFCGSLLVGRERLVATTFCKDRKRGVWDHRIPVEKGGDSETTNYQGLCFFCNKSKWQICNICPLPNCSRDCALAFPEDSKVVAPTEENITDRLTKWR